MYDRNVKDMISILESGEKIFLIAAVSIFILVSLAQFVSASICPVACDSCEAYEVKVHDIIFERLDDGDPNVFCEDDRIRVSAIVVIDGVCDCDYCDDSEVRLKLYVDGEYYGSTTAEVPSSIYRRVEFGKTIYTKDFPVSSSIGVKVVARACCAEDVRIEHFSIKDCEECDWCDWCDCYDGYDWCSRCDWCDGCRRGGEGYTGEFRCFGDYVQGEYVESDCTKHWEVFEYCPYGCVGGSCIPPIGQVQQALTQQPQAQQAQPTKSTDIVATVVSLEDRYKAEKCEVGEFNFEVINIGSVGATFDLIVTGSAADLVFIPSLITLEPRERKSVLAYVHSCNAGSYPFTITASATFDGEAVSTSTDSVLKIVEKGGMIRIGDSLLRTGWATIILACVVVIVVLVAWRIKLGISLGWPRRQRPECFESLHIDVL